MEIIENAPAHDSQRGPNWMWLGPDGLRAGWGITLFLIIAILIGLGLGTLLAKTHVVSVPPKGATKMTFTPRNQLAQEGSVFFAVVLATWFMSKIERRRFGTYGLDANPRRPWQFLQGLVLGFATLSLVIGALYASHAIVFDAQLLHGAALVKYALIWLIGFLLVGLFEEFFFRGYMQYTLARGIGGAGTGRRGIGFWLAAILWNLLFGFAHHGNPGESPIGIFLAGFVGLVFCLSLWYTRSLWWAVGWHCSWDWAESYFYGTADSGTYVRGHLYATHPQGPLLLSGGATGPEGSYYAAVAVVLTAGIIWLTLRHEHNRSTNQELVNPITPQ